MARDILSQPKSAYAAYGVRIEMSVVELPGKPDNQIVVHDHPRSFAERLLATAGPPAVWNVAAQGIQPLGSAILVEQPDGDSERHDTPVAGKCLRCIHEQRRDAEPPEWPGNGDLVNQRDAAVPEYGVVRLPPDRDDADDIVIPHGDEAGSAASGVVGQVLAGGGLTVTDPFDKELNRALKIVLTDRLDDHIRNAHGTRLTRHHSALS